MYDKNSRGSVAYLALAGELIRKTDLESEQAEIQEQEG